MPTDRPFDVVVFGATGFTGRLAAEYLARHLAGAAPRFAIAGRSPEKLRGVKRALVAIDPACESVAAIEADVEDLASLRRMAAQTRVILTTVGPYLRYGDAVVEVCVDTGTDYVDLTGEGAFVDRIVTEYDAQARERGVRVVPCCGFDSIPTDLGVLLTVRELPPDEPIEVATFVRFENRQGPLGAWHSVSGGTWHSALGLLSPAELGRQRASIERIAAQATAGRRVGLVRDGLRRAPDASGWGAPMPTIDREVVLRSAASLAEYGPDFRYGHFARFSSLAWVAAGGLGVGALLGLAQIPPARRFLQGLKQSGDGPSEEERSRNAFVLTIAGKARTRRVVVEVRGGDPGYGETAKMVGEAALCLAQDRARLPERAGVLTPALAMGEPLLERVRKAGITFEVVARS